MTSYAIGLEPAAYERLKKSSPEFVKIYVNALAEGISWSNAELQTKGKKQFYCAPDAIPLNAQNYMDLIDDELLSRASLPGTKEMPVGLTLFRALQRKFPCEQ